MRSGPPARRHLAHPPGEIRNPHQPLRRRLLRTIAKVMAGETKDGETSRCFPCAVCSLIGVALTRDMRPAGEGWEGSLYNFRDGKTYSGKLAMKRDRTYSNCRAACSGGLICRSRMWTRVD